MAVDTIISFLGKGQSGNGYRSANYQFSDGEVASNVPYLGLVLTQKIKPKKLVLLGTNSSMWDVFIDGQKLESDEILTQLMEAVDQKAVDQALLDKCSVILEEKLGCKVVCLLIDYARDERQQVALLEDLSSVLDDKENIAIDVTHSFRHLPMLSMVASRFLQKTRDINTISIYYGALDMTDFETGLTPVIELTGMLKMLDWVDALASFEKHGDYDDFTELYQREGMDDLGNYLHQASFYERINQVANARSPLNKFTNSEDGNNTPITSLFSPVLKKRIAWSQENTFGQRQAMLANYYWEKGDYLRAAILGHEAFITKIVQRNPNADPQSYENRDFVRSQIDDKSIVLSQAENKALSQLRNVRNALAHGTRSDKAEIQRILRSEQELRAFIKHALDTLL